MTEAVRNRLVGLPLDLAVLNLARGRSEGIAPLNQVRRQLFNATGDFVADARTRTGSTSRSRSGTRNRWSTSSPPMASIPTLTDPVAGPPLTMAARRAAAQT